MTSCFGSATKSQGTVDSAFYLGRIDSNESDKQAWRFKKDGRAGEGKTRRGGEVSEVCSISNAGGRCLRWG